MKILSSIVQSLIQTRAENFPSKINFTAKDYLVLLFIPLIFLNAYVAENYFGITGPHLGLADTFFRGLLFAFIFFLYKNTFLEHWQKFKLAKWQSCIFIILACIILQLIISLTKSIVPTAVNSEIVQPEDSNRVNFLTLIVAFAPLFTALIEDVIFRYTLLHKLYIPKFWFRLTVIILNSILFGFIHFNNYDGNILSTSNYMTAGLFLSLIYIFTRNIWHVLLIHLLNNSILLLAVIILWIAQSINFM